MAWPRCLAAEVPLKNLLLAARSLFWTILMPGMVAGYFPWRFFDVDRVRISWSNPIDLAGLLCLAAGAVVLGICIVEFARSGRGTLSPVDPPRELVVRGLYRYVRNPMYWGMTLILLGEATLARSTDLVTYWAVFFTAANIFVIVYEEPYLRGHFGPSYEAYCRQVGRWIPKI